MESSLTDALRTRIFSQIAEPRHVEENPQRQYLRHTLSYLLRNWNERRQSPELKKLDLSCSADALNSSSPVYYPANGLPRIGVFPLAANPIHWGHLIISLAVVNTLELDAMVLLPAGRIDYKPLAEHEDISEHDRHTMVRLAIETFSPILRYSDVSVGTNQPGECAFHTLRKLNSFREINFLLVWGAENGDRVRRIMSQALVCLRNETLDTDSLQRITLIFVDGAGRQTPNLTRERIQELRREVGLPLNTELLMSEMPELSRFSSGNYRLYRDPSLVPCNVHRYVLDHKLYV